MPFNSQRKMNRADMVLAGALRIIRYMRIFGVIMLSAASFDSIRASNIILPPGSSVYLAWNPSPDTAVAGYNVHYGLASRTYTKIVPVGNATNVTISGLVAGATYYFAATAYDDIGQESGYSDEASYLIPGLPTVQLRATSAGQFVLAVSGLIGRTYDIEATQDFSTWTVIGTVTLGSGGQLNFTDTNAVNFSRRFYRTHDHQP